MSQTKVHQRLITPNLANSSVNGFVSVTTQTFAGDKTLVGNTTANNLTTTGNVTTNIVTASGNVTVRGALTCNAGTGTLIFHPSGSVAYNGTTVNTGSNTDYAFQNAAVLAANTLKNTGDRIIITWTLRLGSNADSKVYQTNIGSSARGAGGFTGGINIGSSATTSVNDDVVTTAYVTRVNSNSISYVAISKFVSGSSTQGSTFTTASLDLTVDQLICLGIQSPNSAPTVRITDSHVQFIPAAV